MLVNEEKIEGILKYRAESDDDYGKLAARVKGLEKDEKIVMAKLMLEARRYEKTIADAENYVRRSKEYSDWREEYENGVADFETMRAHRDTAQIIWETWRTEQANLRRA